MTRVPTWLKSVKRSYQKLTRRRFDHGLRNGRTYREAAAQLGVSPSSLWRYLNGQCGPRSKIPARIAAARAAARDDEGGECA